MDIDEKMSAVDELLKNDLGIAQGLLAIASRKAVAAYIIDNNVLVATDDGKVLMCVFSDSKDQEGAIKTIDELAKELKLKSEKKESDSND